MLSLGWFSNRTGTSFDDGVSAQKGRNSTSGAQFAALPLVNQLFDLCAPSSTDAPVLLLNQPIRDLTNGNGNGNGNVTKATGVISKTTILHMHHACSYISLPSLHNCDVKWRNFKITSGPEWQGDKFCHICMHWGAVLSLQLQHKFPSFK